jgi:hypothetical protein
MKFIDISTKKHPNTFAKVDDSDYTVLINFKWCARRKGKGCLYAARTKSSGRIKNETVLMRREIMGAPSGVLIDHIDGNGLNNTRENLRFCDHSENGCNRLSHKGTSKYKGVMFRNSSKKWSAQIGLNGKYIFLGSFDSEVLAAIAYNDAAKHLHGKFARLNAIEHENKDGANG